ncbi:MAG: hypothetical protein QNK23_03965 [Crocinitomicaceae bacterium]|nr:hypothetical protein [Crocinitomicaceae bacterium]
MDLLDEVKSKKDGHIRNITTVVLLLCAVLFFLTAVFLMMNQIESIVVTGPVIGALGLAISILGIVKKRWTTIVNGCLVAVVPGLTLLGIYILRIGPREAKEILPPTIGIFLLVYIPWTIYLVVKEFKDAR